MRLSAKVILNYANINNFDYGNEWTIRAAEANTLYFQLVDLDKDSHRYMAGLVSSPTVIVTFPALDDASALAITATQVHAADASIWKVDLTASQVPASGSVQFSVAEGATTRKFGVLGLMSVEYPDGDGSC